MGRLVTVACNLPNGLILQACEFREENVPVMGGGFRLEKMGRKVGPAVTVFGNAKPFGGEAKARVVAGYALTENVDADLWEKWLAQNAESDVVKNKLIFAYERPGETEHEAKEHKGLRSGLEPMDMAMVTKNGRRVARDPRIPGSGVAGGLTVGPDEKL